MGSIQKVERQSVIDTVNRIKMQLDEIDLETIDGEFYWRCCRRDFVSDIELVRMWLGRIHDAPHGEVRRSIEELSVKYRLPARRIFDRIAYDAPLPMRDIASSVMVDSEQEWNGQPPYWLALKVPTLAWDGKRIERYLWDWLEQHAGPGRLGASTTHIEVWLDLVTEGHPRSEPNIPHPIGIRYVDKDGNYVPDQPQLAGVWSDNIAPPFVEMIVRIPPPPKGVLAAAWEGVVAEHLEWHSVLPSGGTRRQKEVAVRTWAVGLLKSSGMKQREALEYVADTLFPEAGWTDGFNQDRINLGLRVPEARDFLLRHAAQ